MGLTYATPVDIWAIGCIFGELFIRKPLFSGQFEMDQLNKIFDVIGTPDESEWPANAAVIRANFRISPPIDLGQIVPDLNGQGLDLLKVNEWLQKQTKKPLILHSQFSFAKSRAQNVLSSHVELFLHAIFFNLLINPCSFVSENARV